MGGWVGVYFAHKLCLNPFLCLHHALDVCEIAGNILYLGVHYVRYISFDKRFEPQG